MLNKLTLILLTGRQIARLDVAGGRRPRVVALWTRERIEAESTAAQVEAALRLGPAKCGTVWVLSADLWIGTVELTPDVVGMLADEELVQSVLLDAETYSGISAFESRAGLCVLPNASTGERRWWVVQAPSADYVDTARAVKQFGAKWGGLGHAAAFGSLSPESSTDSWRTVQAFGETTVALAGAGEIASNAFSGGDLSTARAQTQLTEWIADTGGPDEPIVWLFDRPVPEGLANAEDPQLLISGEAALHRWAIATALGVQSAQRGQQHAPPIIVAPKQPVSSSLATAIACGIVAVVGLGCYGVHGVFDRQLTAVTAEVERLEAQRKKLESTRQEQKSLEKKAESLNAELTDVRDEVDDLGPRLRTVKQVRRFQQTRWLRFVNALAQSYDGNCWVRQIESDPRMATVKGLAMHSSDIMRLASLLEREAGKHGWMVHPARSEPDESGLIAFSISLDVSDDMFHANPPLAGTTESAIQNVSTP